MFNNETVPISNMSMVRNKFGRGVKMTKSSCSFWIPNAFRYGVKIDVRVSFWRPRKDLTVLRILGGIKYSPEFNFFPRRNLKVVWTKPALWNMEIYVSHSVGETLARCYIAT